MPARSVNELSQGWRYAVDQEFTTSDGMPYPYAENGHRHWGDEQHQLKFSSRAKRACVSSDGSLLAVATGRQIHIVETDRWTTTQVLHGHRRDVENLTFRPKDNNTLVSSETIYNHEERESRSTIIVWKLDQISQMQLDIDQILDEATSSAVAAASDTLQVRQAALATSATELLGKAFKPAVADAVADGMVRDNIQIHGRLTSHFQSCIFSPSGHWMVYLPTERPASNSDALWNIVICSTQDFTPSLTLRGHTDNVLWTGWSDDESMFASVSWDGTARIWNPTSGEVIMRAETGHQNWTGGFSPDSKYFAFTDGRGRVYVHKPRDTEHTEHWVFEDPEGQPRRWRRALSWHSNSRLLAVAGEINASIHLLDVESKSVLQTQTLSARACQFDDDKWSRAVPRLLATTRIRFSDSGNKLAAWGHPDASIEVFDLEKEVKWRFARGGTEDGEAAEGWRDENGRVTSEAGSEMVIWQDKGKGVLVLVSVDPDGPRVWTLPLTDVATE